MLPADSSPSSCPDCSGRQRQPRPRQPRAAARAGKGEGRPLIFPRQQQEDQGLHHMEEQHTHTCAHAPRHTPHTPGTKANMFRPSAGRDTRQRRVVQISRGSLVLVDSPRKKQPPEVVVAQLCKICGVFSVWQLQEGKQGCVLQEGEGMEVQCCVSRCAPGSAASQGVESRKRKEGS